MKNFFKTILRATIATIGLVSKCVPHTLAISIASELLPVLVNALSKYSQNKKHPKAKKALEKLGDTIIFVAKILENHKDSKMDSVAVKQIEKKVK